MVAGLLVSYLPFSTRLMNGALTQIHRELEEAGVVSGAARLKVLTKVTLPLLLPPFLMGCIWVAAHAFRSTQHSTDAEHEGYSYDQRFSLQLWDTEGNFSGAAALGMLLVVCTMILTFMSRRLVQRAFSSWERDATQLLIFSALGEPNALSAVSDSAGTTERVTGPSTRIRRRSATRRLERNPRVCP